jgi:predicted transcriptional regulator
MAKQVMIKVHPDLRDRLKALALKEDRPMTWVLEKLIENAEQKQTISKKQNIATDSMLEKM